MTVDLGMGVDVDRQVMERLMLDQADAVRERAGEVLVPTLGHRHKPATVVTEEFRGGVRWRTFSCACGAVLPERAG